MSHSHKRIAHHLYQLNAEDLIPGMVVVMHARLRTTVAVIMPAPSTDTNCNNFRFCEMHGPHSPYGDKITSAGKCITRSLDYYGLAPNMHGDWSKEGYVVFRGVYLNQRQLQRLKQGLRVRWPRLEMQHY